MTKQTYTEAGSANVTIDGNSHISMGWSQFYIMVVLIVGLAAGITAFQLKTSQSIHDLYVQNQTAHEAIMLKLGTLDSYALKAKVENAFVFFGKQYDIHGTNLWMNEIKFREDIRQFLY